MDNQIGRLRAMLKAHGVAENTAVWFTADNGPDPPPSRTKIATCALIPLELRQARFSYQDDNMLS